MRALIQRVSQASVLIRDQPVAQIERGLLVFLGIEPADTPEDVAWLAPKIARLRIFADPAGRLNLAAPDIAAGILVVSQFTLFASTRKGNRPSFTRAAPPDLAIPLYEAFLTALERELDRPVPRGEFGADMQIHLVNDGPVTLWIDSKSRE